MSKRSSSSSEPSRFARPFIQQGAETLTNTFNSNIGNIQNLTNDITGSLAPNLLERFEQGDAGVNAARDYNTGVLNGDYLNGNPYLDDLIAQSNNDITNETQAALGLRGLTGGSNYADIISDNVARNTLGLRFDDYNRERSRQDAAAGRAGSIAQADYLPVGALFGTLNAAQAPLDAAGTFAGGIGGLLGNSTTQTSRPGLLNSLLGAGAQVGSAALLASERRVKRDIRQIDTLSDGLGVYKFRYVWDEDDAPLHTGVMVDEVTELRPWALGPVIDGIQTVDYSKLENAA